MTIEITLRAATLQDIPDIIRLYAQTILTVCTADYDHRQLQMWAKRGRDPLRWEQRIKEHYFVVAEIGCGIVGFASLTKENHLDVFYVSKDHQRQGIASEMFEMMSLKALNNPVKTISADVSKTAEPFFTKLGFQMIKVQEHLIEGVLINNFRMEKVI